MPDIYGVPQNLAYRICFGCDCGTSAIDSAHDQLSLHSLVEGLFLFTSSIGSYRLILYGIYRLLSMLSFISGVQS
jgi:hypothetical protein